MGVNGDDIAPLASDSGRRKRRNEPREAAIVQASLKMFTSLLAVATAATIAAAPMAVADPSTGARPTCYQSGPGTQCQSPGNVQFNDAPPQVNYFPLGDD